MPRLLLALFSVEVKINMSLTQTGNQQQNKVTITPMRLLRILIGIWMGLLIGAEVIKGSCIPEKPTHPHSDD